MKDEFTRRQFLGLAGSAAVLGAVPLADAAIRRGDARDDDASDQSRGRRAAVRTGKVKLDMPPLVENGNTVSMTVSVDSPMTAADHVVSIHVFNEKNPQPNMGNFYLGPRAGRAQISTRIRLADSQKIIAIAKLSDGSFWSATTDVVVTLAACTDELI